MLFFANKMQLWGVSVDVNLAKMLFFLQIKCGYKKLVRESLMVSILP